MSKYITQKKFTIAILHQEQETYCDNRMFDISLFEEILGAVGVHLFLVKYISSRNGRKMYASCLDFMMKFIWIMHSRECMCVCACDIHILILHVHRIH